MGWAVQRSGTATVWMRRAGLLAFVNLVQGTTVSALSAGGGGGGGARGGRTSRGQRATSAESDSAGSGGSGGSGKSVATDVQVAASAAAEEEEDSAQAGMKRKRDVLLAPGRAEHAKAVAALAAAAAAGAAAVAVAAGTATAAPALGGDDLFGDGFVAELAAACGAALGPADRCEFSKFVHTGAQWMLGLCVKEAQRMVNAAYVGEAATTNGISQRWYVVGVGWVNAGAAEESTVGRGVAEPVAEPASFCGGIGDVGSMTRSVSSEDFARKMAMPGMDVPTMAAKGLGRNSGEGSGTTERIAGAGA